MKQIELLPLYRANKLVLDEMQKSLGASAGLIKSTLEKFIKELYTAGYIIAFSQDCQDIFERMRLRETNKLTVSRYTFFSGIYAKEFLLAKAIEYKLPVALINKILEQIVFKLYNTYYFFGVIAQDEKLPEHQEIFIVKNMAAFLVFKENSVEKEICVGAN
jgi:hypothetical protein